MDDVARCAGPHCGRPLARAATGRRALYCGQNCRQAARRARIRAAEEAAARAARLAGARATTARLRRPLETAGHHDVGELAGTVVAAASPGRPRSELEQAIRDLHQAAAHLASMARDYRAAADLARQLDPGGALAVS